LPKKGVKLRLGVENIMVPVMADSWVSDAWDYDLPYIGYGNGFWEVFDYDAQTGSWTITAQNKQNDTDSMVTHDLDKPRVVPLATGIQFAGPLLTPAISWDSVFFNRDGNPDTPSEEVDQYRVRIYSPGSSFNIHDSGSFSGVTNYDVPSGVLDAGELYYVRVEARHLDGGYLESRSNTFEPFSTVPIPGAVWLLGSGLVGLVGLRKKFKK
jgi:hypothetical protein